MCFNTNNSTDSLFFFFCLTTIADQCHNWYEMMQQAETDSEWLPLKKQTQQKRSDSALQMNAYLGEMERRE